MPTKLTPEQILDLHKRYLAGESSTDLAKVAGVHNLTIRKGFLRLGLSVRSHSDARTIEASRAGANVRAKRAVAAHDAIRGKKRPINELLQRAATRQNNPPLLSSSVKRVVNFFDSCGIAFDREVACGKYNIDFVIYGNIAVEVFGGQWHGSGRHATRHEKRIRYILDQGFHVIIIWVNKRTQDAWIRALSDTIAEIYKLRGDPTALRQYRVIWSDGNFCVSRNSYDNDFPFKPSFVTFRNPDGRYGSCF
jgi:very-short-patch-repair endonuclease